MKTSASAARGAVEGLGVRGKTTRIPDKVRSAVLGYAREARSSGESWSEIAETVGLSPSILQRWNQSRPKETRLKPVVIREALLPSPSTGLVLITASGERLEGVGIEEAVLILRGLR